MEDTSAGNNNTKDLKAKTCAPHGDVVTLLVGLEGELVQVLGSSVVRCVTGDDVSCTSHELHVGKMRRFTT